MWHVEASCNSPSQRPDNFVRMKTINAIHIKTEGDNKSMKESRAKSSCWRGNTTAPGSAGEALCSRAEKALWANYLGHSFRSPLNFSCPRGGASSTLKCLPRC